MPVTNYIWDDEIDAVLMETDEAGATTAVYENEPVPYGRLLSQHRGSQTSYYHFDGLGSTRALTNQAGTVSDTYAYTAFGEQVATTGATENPFRWIGQLGYYFNFETSEYYVRARVYEPTTARWKSADPLDCPGAANLYVAVGNNPINLADPAGLASVDELIGGLVAGVIAGIVAAGQAANATLCVAWHAVQMINTGWMDVLPACPCCLRSADSATWLDPTAADPDFHPGAEECIRSKVGLAIPPKPGQQCCYIAGALITEGPGRGTPDKISPGPGVTNVGGHFTSDVLPFLWCKQGNRLDLYLEARKPNNAIGCEPMAS
jgi:RHS repeat-associated protein